MTRRVTLADVSRAAGVGIATVSRALGDHRDVSQATRDRIVGIARELGYRPSRTARALRTGSYHAISAIVPDAGWGWWEPVIRAAHTAASEHGYHLLVHPVAGVEGGTAGVIDSLADVPTEGIVAINSQDQAGVRAACERVALPAVAIDDTSHELHLPTISARNRAGARLAVEHLLAQGRRDIALVYGDIDDEHDEWGDGRFMQARIAGYREALAAAGVAVDDELVLACRHPFDETTETWPELDALLRSGRRVDAVFCAADLMAAPALRSLRRAGLRVPEDVAVAAFDDERAALLVDPQLTTVRQPYDELGRSAVERLLRMIDGRGEHEPFTREELPVELIVRASSRLTGDSHV